MRGYHTSKLTPSDPFPLAWEAPSPNVLGSPETCEPVGAFPIPIEAVSKLNTKFSWKICVVVS